MSKIKKITMNKLDKLWSLCIKLMYGNKCFVCGATRYVQAHHLITRRCAKFRYCLKNGLPLCFKHHNTDFEISGHNNPFMLDKLLKEKLPQIQRMWKSRRENMDKHKGYKTDKDAEFKKLSDFMEKNAKKPKNKKCSKPQR